MSKGTRLPAVLLKREASLHQIETILEIRRQTEREELIALLRFGKEQVDDGIEFTPRRVVEEWLVGFPVSAGQRLLRRLEDLKLIRRKKDKGSLEFLPPADESYTLTDEGRGAEEGNVLFMPERIAAVIQYTNDPLIPDKIVSLQTHKERLKELIVKDENRRTKIREYDAIDIPDELRETTGREIEVLEGDRAGRVIIDSFDRRAIPLETESKMHLDLRLSIQSRPKLSATIASRTHDIAIAHDVERHLEYMKVLPNLIRQVEHRWSDKKQAIVVGFGEVDDQQKRAFAMDVEVQTPEVQHLGSFESCSLKSVPIAPWRKGDAQRWFEFLVVEGITTFMTESAFVQHVEKQRELFARFDYDLEAPSINDLVDRFSRTQDDKTYHPIYWYLNTPRDLCTGEGD